ncbi:hypothetical protein [Myxosarcina sp. GI1(2024)]
MRYASEEELREAREYHNKKYGHLKPDTDQEKRDRLRDIIMSGAVTEENAPNP